MDINAVIKVLNTELSMTIPTSYYSRISEWDKWWRGTTSFHRRLIEQADGSKKATTIYSLKMAKKVCEDWASILLNEKTEITVNDAASSEWLHGKDGTGGVFSAINFWSDANALVEKTFYSGAGAFVLKIDGMGVKEDQTVIPSEDAKIRMDYLPASNIVPISVHYGRITECAFASDVVYRGKTYVYVETHLLENGLYVIHNKYYKYENGTLQKATLPEGIAETVYTNSPIPFFSIIKPNIVNPYKKNLGLGCSVFSQAIDNLKGVDLAYNNLNQDFYLGGKKVFYDRSLGKTSIDGNGNVVTLAPDEVQQRLFWQVGDGLLTDGKNPIYEFNPSLRVSENVEGIQAQLDYLSFKCGLGTRYYKFNPNTGAAVTATEYAGEKQELKQNAAKHIIVINSALVDIVRSMLWVGKNIIGVPVNENADIMVKFSDGYIVSDEERRARALQEYDRGLIQGYEYRMEFKGEDEATAKSKVQRSTIFGDE